MSNVYPVILAGGSGTRLWPLSRKSYPKQFSNLIGDKTLFQSSAIRMTSSGMLKFASVLTITHDDFRFIIGEQLQEVGINPGPIIIEPEAKNTAAAILAASLFTHATDQDAVLLAAPADHVIPDTKAFHAAIKNGLSHVRNRKMVTFGIKPTHPETGYGYLELSKNSIDDSGAADVLSFVEKPNINDAKQMLEDGNYFWNSGIFLFRAKDMVEAFKTYAPETLDLVSKAVLGASPDLGFLRLASSPWSELQNISIDYAIMEKAQNLVNVPYISKWSDLGGWDAVWSEGFPDAHGNVTSETAHAIDCANSLLRSESDNQQIVGLGLEDIIAVAMPDAVLVADKKRAQDVKGAVDLLKIKNIEQAEAFPKDHRPWGWFESLVIGDRFQVKRIHVKPSGCLSLQSHQHRSEHWIVVEGTAKVTIDDNVKLISEGQSVFVPLGSIHRMENPGKLPLVIIEVQLGTYLGEDDIIRYSDVYKRT